MKRLVCLLFLGAALGMTGLWPALAKVAGVPETVAVVSPPVSTVTTRGGCTPINPCAMAPPAVSDVSLPAPETPPQPQLGAESGSSAGANSAQTPRPAASSSSTPNAAANCPPARGRGDFAGRGRGESAGRFGQGRGQGGQGFGQGGRGEGGRGGGQAGRGGQFAQNSRGGRGPDGCPPAGRATQAGTTR